MLALFGDVRPGEGLTVLLLASNVFLLLGATPRQFIAVNVAAAATWLAIAALAGRAYVGRAVTPQASATAAR